MISVSHEGIAEVYDLLYGLGLTANYTGFFYLSYAVWLASTQPDRLLLVTKWLYPEVAKRYHTNWRAVERGIRYALKKIRVADTPLLEYIVGTSLRGTFPSASFIALLAKFYAAHRAA